MQEASYGSFLQLGLPGALLFFPEQQAWCVCVTHVNAFGHRTAGLVDTQSKFEIILKWESLLIPLRLE